MKLDHVYYINLDRRPDRLSEVKDELDRVGLKNISIRFPAIDGNKLTDKELSDWTTSICNTFCTRSLIGCAMSHKLLWQKFYESSDNTVLIIEDDVEFKVDNIPKFLEQNDHLIPRDFDILYLGCFGGCSLESTVSGKVVPLFMGKGLTFGNPIKQINEKILKPYFPIGAHAYILSKRGCEKLLSLTNKVYNHIDAEIASNVYDGNLIAYTFKDPIAIQDGSIQTTDNAEHTFPIMINKLLDQIKTVDNQRFGYIFNVTSYKIPILDIPINLYLGIVLLIGIGLTFSGQMKRNGDKIWKIFLLFAFIDIALGKSKNKWKSVKMAAFLLGALYLPYFISNLKK
jgi:GR25 family glycosyltransferase involved in LPS biosynthesis